MKKIVLILVANFASLGGAIADDLVSFSSPSKNIYCIGVNSETEGGSVDCELLTRTNNKPSLKRPEDCDLEWGNRFFVGSDGNARLICAGDTLRDEGAMVLGYGKGLDRFGIHCTSSEEGIECINDDQHGFKISKASQVLY